MVDLHAHLLAGLDDGPESMADSLKLLRTMHEQGVQTVVAAAHAYDGRYNVSRDALLAAHDDLQRVLEQEGLTIRVLPSMELYLSFELLNAVKRQQVVGLGGISSRYLLVELPHREFPIYAERALFELMMAGYRPIVNHPERNRGIQKRPDLMYRLSDQGVLAMVTAASLVGRFSPETQGLAEEFIREGVADLVVSDAHDLKGRAPVLPEGLAAAAKLGKVDQAAEAALLGL